MKDKGGIANDKPMGSVLKEHLEALELPFVSVTLRIQGTMASTREYEVLKLPEGSGAATGVRVSLYDGPWQYNEGTSRESCLVKRKEGDTAMYEALSKAFGRFGLRNWDGFNESDPNALDGEIISFEAILTDGSKISGHGSNAYPKNYRVFLDCLEEVLEA